MSGGYSRRGTAAANRVERSVDEAMRATADAQRVARAPMVAAAEQLRVKREQMPAVEAARLVLGWVALDRKGGAGTIVRKTLTSVTLRDAEGLEWRVEHGDVIHSRPGVQS